MAFKIIVSSEDEKQELLEESEYVHYLTNADSELMGTLMHIFLETS
jgi:hypothetical protein